MIALSLKRQVVLTLMAAFAATAAFAVNPSARYETRMVFDAQSSHMILFGGVTGIDSGTRLAYRLDDTWEWTGSHWIQRFPAHTPVGRSAHAMVYDSNRSRIVMFGGRSDSADLADTWVYQNMFQKSDWTQLDPHCASGPTTSRRGLRSHSRSRRCFRRNADECRREDRDSGSRHLGVRRNDVETDRR